MSLIEVFATPAVLGALALFIAAALAEPLLEQRLHHALDDNKVFAWWWDKLFGPMLRAVLIIALVLALYPIAYGITEAPTLATLHEAGHLRLTSLLNVVMVFALLLPMVPLLGQHEEFVLPAQAFIASTMVFSWLADYLSLPGSFLLPRFGTTLALFGLAFLFRGLAAMVVVPLGHRIDEARNMEGAAVWLLRGMELGFIGPLVVIYGYTLAAPLAI
ncbi:MAG: hypothetical protein HKO62_02500 [Gammaproteobacteria bacterium]|nr:hypothetical protein [Gammaproteobacteria bacterium]NNL99593.1 hypothetical protein [Gammaproteobacteria bacterium]